MCVYVRVCACMCVYVRVCACVCVRARARASKVLSFRLQELVTDAVLIKGSLRRSQSKCSFPGLDLVFVSSGASLRLVQNLDLRFFRVVH